MYNTLWFINIFSIGQTKFLEEINGYHLFFNLRFISYYTTYIIYLIYFNETNFEMSSFKGKTIIYLKNIMWISIFEEQSNILIFLSL